MKFLILDTETTGLISNALVPLELQPFVIEFYGELIDGETGAVIEELDFMCSPGFQITEEITKITGITNDDLAGKPRFSFYIDQIQSLMDRADAIVAHNLSYDAAVLEFEFKRAGKEVLFPAQKICTVEETEYLNGFRLNLGLLYERLFNERFSGAHRARNDVKALTKCFLKLREEGMI